MTASEKEYEEKIEKTMDLRLHNGTLQQMVFRTRYEVVAGTYFRLGSREDWIDVPKTYSSDYLSAQEMNLRTHAVPIDP